MEILLIPFLLQDLRKFDTTFRTWLQHEEKRGLCEPNLLPFEQKLKGSIVS